MGVQALCSCNLENITALSHVAESLRIVLPAFNFLSNLIYKGYNIIAPMKVASVKLRIKIRLLSMFDIDSIKIFYFHLVCFSDVKKQDKFDFLYDFVNRNN